jgi:hypothetical protein
LKEGFSLDNEVPATKTKGAKTNPEPKLDDLPDPAGDEVKPEIKPEEDATLPDLDSPDSKPEVDPQPEPEVKPEPETKPEPEPTPEPNPTPEPESKPEEPKIDPEPKPETEPQPEPQPETEAETEPKEVHFALPERSRPVDPLAEQKLAVNAAHQTFDEASAPADKKAAAIVLYRAAAELAEQLPRDAEIPAELSSLTSDAKKLQFVGIYAASWQENIERATPGIVLSGTVKDCQQVGERYEVRVELPARDKRELLLITATACQTGQKLFAAGRFVMSARDMVSGYTGDATMAIDARVVKVVE